MLTSRQSSTYIAPFRCGVKSLRDLHFASFYAQLKVKLLIKNQSNRQVDVYVRNSTEKKAKIALFFDKIYFNWCSQVFSNSIP